jgi:hypothetical protein
MPRGKKFAAEQIIEKLREAWVGATATCSRGPAIQLFMDRRGRKQRDDGRIVRVESHRRLNATIGAKTLTLDPYSPVAVR